MVGVCRSFTSSKHRLKIILVFSFLASTSLIFVFLLEQKSPLNLPSHAGKKPAMTPCAGFKQTAESKHRIMDTLGEGTHGHNSRLTHVVMPFHTTQESRVINNLQLWHIYPPCSSRTTFDYSEPSPTFVFFSSSDYDRSLEQRLLHLFASIPRHLTHCFSHVQVRFANVPRALDTYLLGSRFMFESLLNNTIDLQAPDHIFYMEPDCRPIRENWQSVLMAQVRWPNAQFWIKGSMFRGDLNAPGVAREEAHDLVHINGNAVYNLRDPAFRQFYFVHVRPFVKTTNRPYDTDIWLFLLNGANYLMTQKIAHKFQLSEYVQNWYHSPYSVKMIQEASRDTVLVHGGEPMP